ncbi:MAG: alpha/beta hydrolase fold domain-containing protein, partial [Phocaeicola sp.]
MLRKSLLILLTATILPVSSHATSENKSDGKKEVMKVAITDNQIDMVSGITYSQITSLRANRQLKMTLLTPRTKELKPAIIYFPGGGFTSADHEKYIEMRMALAKAGFVVAAAEYRVVPNKFPALVVDAKSAVRYLRANAEKFGIDPNRIGVIGDSAGGYVAQMAGATNGEEGFDQGDYLDQSSDVQAVVTIYGISNLLNIGEGYSQEIQDVHASPAVTEALLVHGPAFATFAGSSIFSDTKKALEASPMGHIKNNMPPYLIMHGSEDKLVSSAQSEQLYKALNEKGNKAEYVVVEGAGHGDLYWFQEPI